MNNLKDIIDDFKIRKIVKEEKKCNPIVVILVIIGIIVVIAAAAYALYRFFAPEYVDDLDDFEDEFDGVLSVGEEVQIHAHALGKDTDNVVMSFDSSDSSIATVDADGYVKALKEGTVTISCIVGQNESYFEVNVTKEINVICAGDGKPTITYNSDYKEKTLVKM